MTSMNYICYWDVHKYFSKHNFANQLDSIFPEDAFAINMLCVSKLDSSRLAIMKEQDDMKIDVENKKYFSHQYNFTTAGMHDTVHQHECTYATIAHDNSTANSTR